MDAYVFEAALDEYPDVSRRLALRSDQTLVDLHEELRRAFEWWDDHLYSFWLDSEFWGSKESEYTSPIEPENGVKTADVEVARLAGTRARRSPTSSTSVTSGGSGCASRRSVRPETRPIPRSSSAAGRRRRNTRSPTRRSSAPATSGSDQELVAEPSTVEGRS